MLSHRLLYFTERHFLFKCNRAVLIDILPTNSAHYDPRYADNVAADLLSMVVWVFQFYAAMVSEYTRRETTRSANALNAIAGVFHRATTNCGATFINGLKASHAETSDTDPSKRHLRWTLLHQNGRQLGPLTGNHGGGLAIDSGLHCNLLGTVELLFLRQWLYQDSNADQRCEEEDEPWLHERSIAS